MRLKQLLVVLITLLAFTVSAFAAGSELTNVSVASQNNATTLTLQTSGAFTHNEYRPADNLLLVDLSGVTAGKLNDRSRDLDVPGVKSYRVVGYKGAAGAEITRVEISLLPGAAVMVNETKAGVQVQVTGTTKTASAQPEARQAATPVAKASDKLAVIENLSVNRGAQGLEIAIGPVSGITPQTQRVEGPDRIVLDIPNSVPATRLRQIAVNSPEVKSVRIGQYKSDPPVTRIVLDLAANCDYQVVPADGKLLLKVQATTSVSPKPMRPGATPRVLNASADESEGMPHLQTASLTSVTPEPAPAKRETTAPAVKPLVVATDAEELANNPRPAVVEAAALKLDTPAAALPEAPKTVEMAKADPAPLAKEEAKPAEQKSEYVMVEPTFKPKTAEQKPATVQTASVQPAPLPANGMIAQPVMAANLALEQQQQMAQTQPVRPKYTGEPISVNLKDVDLKDFFRLIHEISGLNIVLDPNVKGTLTLVLDDVPWDQALDIVLRNNSLDRQLDNNVLRIATLETLRKEADARRAQIEAQALAVDKQTVTRFLSYAHAKDVVPTVKKFLSARGDITADERTNALIIQDIPNVIPEIDRLLTQLDRKTQEVEIEARVVAATRQFARDIGTQLGFGIGNSGNTLGGAGAIGTSPLQVGYTAPPPYFTIPGFDASKVDPTQPPVAQALAIPLFTNLKADNPTSGLSFSHITGSFRLDAILTAAESRGLLKILSRPRVVTQNNITAVVRQGFRVPIVTQAQLGGPPTVTYVDAFLRLTVTPQITVENTIFLAVDVENTTPDFSRTVQGNPTLVTSQATTQVLVTDGGTVVIGGVIQSKNSVSTFQVPFLGDIPILGNAFKRRSVTTETQELIFFLTPKIIQT
jgi:type IV pilus secretin PilQ/predicted competence protein